MKAKEDPNQRYLLSLIESIEEKVSTKLKESDEITKDKIQPKLALYQDKCKSVFKSIERVVFQHESSQDSMT